jgi:hypothetical protein
LKEDIAGDRIHTNKWPIPASESILV